MAYQDILNALARFVGGTQPTADQIAAGSQVPSKIQPWWYSGSDTGDDSGVAGLVGCFSLPVEAIDQTPVGMVLPALWKPDGQPSPRMGLKLTLEEFRLRLLTGHDDLTQNMADLVNFRDSIEEMIASHMTLGSQPTVETTDCRQGEFLEIELGGEVYLSIEFAVFIHRASTVQYSG